MSKYSFSPLRAARIKERKRIFHLLDRAMNKTRQRMIDMGKSLQQSGHSINVHDAFAILHDEISSLEREHE